VTRAALAAAISLATAAVCVRAVRSLAPDDLVWTLRAGGVYVLRPRADGMDDVGLSSAPNHAGTQEPVAAGTHARVLDLRRDEANRPAAWVRVLDGPAAGAKGYVSRWEIRHERAPKLVGLTRTAWFGLVLAAAGWTLLYLGLLRAPPAQREHDRAEDGHDDAPP